ncbi:hypothetical protein [Candidatus Palauibacter sp.]|uniref:hypothetical protein n=1 Tax=Candidatus Palauibacter sp. TaxID=3101350 RepID=UPI003AF25027
MNRRAPALGVVAIAVAASGCGREEPRARQTVVVDSSDVAIVTSDPLNSDRRCTVSQEPTFAVGEISGDERYEFFQVRGAGRLSDGSVAVAERATADVRIFSPSGQHVRSMGGEGEGPGEFRNPYVLWVLPGDTLWIGDYRPPRYNVFTAEGEFVRSVQLHPLYANPSRGGGVLSNGYSVNVRSEGRASDYRTPRDVIVEVHGPDGILNETLRVLEGRRYGPPTGSMNLTLDPLFEAGPSVDAAGTTIAISTGRDPEVQLVDEQLRLYRIVRWLDPERDVTSAHVRAWREEYLESREGAEGMAAEFTELTAGEDRPIADRFPTVSSLAVGRDGRIWVRRYPRPRESGGWMVFEPDGEFLCHLGPVPGLGVYEFGADYLLGTRRDSLDVESVVMFDLHPPPDPVSELPGGS